jgi:glycosyltransferase involved in cell wall biosynthesis
LHIIIFACVDFPEGPATTSRIKLLSRILIAAGHQVSLAIFNANAKTLIPENQAPFGAHESIEYTYLSGSTVRPIRFRDIMTDTFKGIARSMLYLRSKIKDGAADMALFYTPDIFRSLPCLLLSKFYGIPVVHILDEVFSSDRSKHGLKAAVKWLGACLSERLLPRMSDGVFAISTRIAAYLRQVGVSDAAIMHLPILVDCDKFMPPSRSLVPALSEKWYFLNSGALNAKEGLETILQAFAATTETHDRLFLALTGDPEPGRKAPILNLARKLGIDHKLLFTGFLPLEQLVWAYQHAVALICCRADTEYANYGFPTKLGEYLTSGRPVIINGVGDMLLYMKDGENAFLTRAEDSGSINEAMKRILTDLSHADRIGAMGRRIALEKFNYTNFVNQVDAFLRAVHSGR